LFDTHGNVWEWCRDGKRKYSETPQVDPTGDSEGSNRVIRGGSWFDVARYVRSACRSRFVPGHRGSLLGFRLLSLASAEPSRFGAAEVFSHVFSVHDIDAKPIEFPLADLVPVSLQPTMKSESEPALSTRTSTLLVSSNLEKIRYERVEKPEWAVAYGQDPYGTYADIRVDGLGVDDMTVRQRLRWIPPGRFQMGSPEGEPGRRDDESLHDVTLSHGYWMFDTPCTQRLWQAVMPNNPSTFKDPDRPVENVSWDDANEFAAQWNRKLARFAIEFRLPTEAEWEYACRAGTVTAIYSGDLEILGNANAPALDAIAWYGGNCGYEYDLDVSQSLEHSWLSDQQYPAKRGGTRKVKGKAPNALGLYDMLGNVWEWCSDWYCPYGGESSIDPIGDLEGSYRVVRGGSWFYDAALVRSAYRLAGGPGDRLEYLGFRLLSSARKKKQVTGGERRERFEREAEGRGRTKNKRSK
jgi:formylglycine-generating enzyme required for sulfatase activity